MCNQRDVKNCIVIIKYLLSPFEQVHALNAGKDFVKGVGMLASEVIIRGESCDQAMLNNGTFGAQYDAQVGNIELVESGRVDGKFAGNFTENSRFAIFGVGPYSGGEMVSFSLFRAVSCDKN